MADPARILYLDNLRFALVALVVPLHAYYTGFPQHAWIALLHDSFHMAALFLISGYFAAPLVARQGGRAFLRHRGRALLPPLLVIFALSFPTYALHLLLKTGSTAGYWNDLAGLALTGQILLHGWFLAVLLLFVALAGPVLALLRAAWVARIARAVPPRVQGVAIALLATLTAWPAEVLWTGTDGPLGLPLFVYEALRYLWAFALGMAAWHSPALRDWLHRPDPLVGLLALVAWVLTFAPLDLTNAQWEAAWALRRVTSAILLTSLCLMTFRRLANRPHHLAAALAEAGMTVFVTQWALLYVFALALPLGFWQLSALALASGVAIHHGLVKRSDLAMNWIAGNRRAVARPVLA